MSPSSIMKPGRTASKPSVRLSNSEPTTSRPAGKGRKRSWKPLCDARAILANNNALQFAAGSGNRVDPIPCRGTADEAQLDPDQEAGEAPIIKAEEPPQ